MKAPKLDVRASLLVYDIPDDCAAQNPSWRLRRIGVRVNLSVWVVPDEHIPWGLLDTLAEQGASWHVVRFDASEAPNLAKMVVAALMEEVASTQRRLRVACENAGFVLDQRGELEGSEAQDACKKYKQRCQAAVCRAERLLEAAQAAAKAFGIDKAALPMKKAADAIDAIWARARARAAAYADMAKLAVGTSMEHSAAADAVPPPILADFLEESGEDVGAARRVFGEEE